jgi:hypothetical protein
MESKRIARLAREGFLNEPLFKGFTDIRKKPQIRLQAILTSLFLMPFFATASLLSNDREARTERYKKLFGCRRKMVASDSTLARVLRWLRMEEVKAFLESFLPQFEKRDLLRRRLTKGGRLWRLGILDGSYMGGHWLVALCLPGRINCPLMVEPCESQGKEQTVAREMMRQASTLLGRLKPELWLLDALHFTVNTIRRAKRCGSAVLFKFKNADFRTVTKDAQNLFEHFGGDEEAEGRDPARQCRWKARKTQDTFGGFRVQVVQVTEYYPKRKSRRKEQFWIVSTELSLSIEEIREAAHLRWQIENNVFKRISHLSGTKRFYFKDERQFFNLLRLFFAAIAILDSIILLLLGHQRLFGALRAGIKGTWRNVFSRIRELLYSLPCAFEQLT